MNDKSRNQDIYRTLFAALQADGRLDAFSPDLMAAEGGSVTAPAQPQTPGAHLPRGLGHNVTGAQLQPLLTALAGGPRRDKPSNDAAHHYGANPQQMRSLEQSRPLFDLHQSLVDQEHIGIARTLSAHMNPMTGDF